MTGELDPTAVVEVEVEADGADEVDGGDESGGGDDEDAESGTHPWSWHLARVPGLFLAVLLVGHFVSSFLLSDIAMTTAATVTDRWHAPTARLFEWLVLTLALLHAGMALHQVVLRRDDSPSVAFALDAAIFLFCAVFIGATTVVVLTLR